MDLVIKIIGILFVLIAIGYFSKPAIITGLMEFFKKGKRMYFAGLIRFALARRLYFCWRRGNARTSG
jgi:hypothetical protein